MSWSNVASDYRKQKEIEEARKQGRMAPEKDAEGNDINPHIPEYIKNAPWYLASGAPGLQHQRTESFDQKKFNRIEDTWYSRGKFQGPAVTKFREGACKNCGSMTHKVKDCVERPRKLAAKYSGKDIMPDEVIKSVSLDFDGKRDRWNGFQPDMYKKVMDEFEEADMLRRKKLAAKLDTFMTEPDATSTKFPSEGSTNTVNDPAAAKKRLVDEMKSSDKTAAQKVLDPDDPRAVVHANNLPSREDRAKYLHNLELDSAFYDPKSRSMRENPYAGVEIAVEDVPFRGDNESIFTGDTREYYQLQRYAWEQYGAANVAAPSESEVLFENFKERKADLEQKKQKELLTQYGGEEHMTSVPSSALRMGQVEVYKEYAPDGTLLPAYRNSIPKSKYPEDVLMNNHTTVWGSWYDRESGNWGYKCCRQTHKQAYCSGQILIPVKAPAVLPVT